MTILEQDQTAIKMKELSNAMETTYNHWLQFTLAINFAFNTIHNIDTLQLQTLRSKSVENIGQHLL